MARSGLDRRVWVDVHLHIFRQLMGLECDKLVQQTHEIAQGRFIARTIEAASPLYVADRIRIGFVRNNEADAAALKIVQPGGEICRFAVCILQEIIEALTKTEHDTRPSGMVNLYLVKCGVRTFERAPHVTSPIGHLRFVSMHMCSEVCYLDTL